MPDLNTFLGWATGGTLEGWVNDTDRDVSFLVGYGGVSVAFYRPTTNTTLAAQTVHLGPAGQNTSANVQRGDAGQASIEQLLIVGTDALDVQKGDTFAYLSPNSRHNYKIVRVEKAVKGQIHAFAEQVS